MREVRSASFSFLSPWPRGYTPCFYTKLDLELAGLVPWEL